MPDVEGGILPPGMAVAHSTAGELAARFGKAEVFFRRAGKHRLYGRQGCPPLHGPRPRGVLDFENTPELKAFEDQLRFS